MLSVLLFHLDYSVFGGGFVGVDVFFVISGFLITSIVRRECSQGSFELLSFYERRIRRIIPALYAMLAATLLFGACVLIPPALEVHAASGLRALYFFSNRYFYAVTGYFGPDSDEIPLLHTWSLAIEEQFYVGLPLLVWGTHFFATHTAVPAVIRRLFRWTGWPLVVAALVSFVWSEAKIPEHESAAFFLIQTRAWELLVGSLLSTLPRAPNWNRAFFEAAAVAGLLMIFVAVFTYNEATPFPGATALLPTIGAALVLYATSTSHTNSVKRVLSSWVAVRVGLASYSIYLWHWPVIAFCRYLRDDWMQWRPLLAAFSIALGFASWRWVETPFRHRAHRSAPVFVSWFAATILLAFGFGFVEFTEGWPQRLSARAQQISAMTEHAPRTIGCTSTFRCTLGKANVAPTVALIGDSHAAQYVDVVDELARELGIAVEFYSLPGCPPLPEVGLINYPRQDCAAPFRGAIADLNSIPSLKRVLVVARWDWYTSAPADDCIDMCTPTRTMQIPGGKQGIDAMKDRLPQLEQLFPRFELVLFGHHPVHRTMVGVEAAKASFVPRYTYDDRGRPRQELQPRFAPTQRALFDAAASSPRVSFLNPLDTLCPDGFCPTMNAQGMPLFRDDDHLTIVGQHAMREPMLRALLGDVP